MKNFGSYLPTPDSSFTFAFLFKSKKQVIFAVLSQGLGKGSISMVVNLTDNKIFNKSDKTKATSGSFDGVNLKFGSEEISIKNNGPLEVRVSTAIFGERYYTFKKEELVSKKEEANIIQL